MLTVPLFASLDRTVNLLEDPSFEDFTIRLNAERSLSDKREDIFSMNENGLLHVTGKGWGYLRTNSIFRDYHLVLEYKWGEQKLGYGADRSRASGLFFHAYGTDIEYDNTWPTSILVKLHERDKKVNALHTGDFMAIAHSDSDGNKAPTRFTATVRTRPEGGTFWTPEGQKKSFPNEKRAMGRSSSLRGDNYAEKPLGEWNRIEVICRGDSMRVILNGTLINECSNTIPSEGFVALQTNCAELWVRKWELRPLDPVEGEKSVK